jgi:hypothetical protein
MIKVQILGKKFNLYTVNERIYNSLKDDNWKEDEIPGEFNILLGRYPYPYIDKGHNHEIPDDKEIDDYNEALMKWLANEVGDKNATIERIVNRDSALWREPDNPTGKFFIL